MKTKQRKEAKSQNKKVSDSKEQVKRRWKDKEGRKTKKVEKTFYTKGKAEDE